MRMKTPDDNFKNTLKSTVLLCKRSFVKSCHILFKFAFS